MRLNRTRRAAVRAALLPLLIMGAASTLQSFFPGPPGFGCLLLGSATTLIVWLTGMVRAALAGMRRKWILSGVRLISLAASLPLAYLGLVCGDYVHLAVMSPHYRRVIEHSPPGAVRFPWGDSAVLVLDGLQFRTLVYDDTAETAGLVGTERMKQEGIFAQTDHFVGNFFMEHEYAR